MPLHYYNGFSIVLDFQLMLSNVTDGLFDYVGSRQQITRCGNLAVVLWSVRNIFIQVIFFWQWGRKLIKKDSEPTVFSFASATSRKPPMNRNLTQSVGHSVEQVSSVDSSASCQPELPVSVDSSKLMDDHQYCLKSPKKLSRQVSELTKKLHNKTAALRNARKSERRLHGRVEDLLKRLKNMQLLNEQAEKLLEVFKHMPLNLLSGKAGTCFTQDQKQFAITLYYYSPAAYQYVRRRFNLLPSPRTIRNWLSSFEGSPGLTQQSFDTICEKIQRNDDDS